jgi:ABC-type uncharacterized transport system ATPase subunit
MISDGKVFYDGLLDAFRERYGDKYKIEVQLADDDALQHPLITIAKTGERTYTLMGDQRVFPVAEAIAYCTREHDVRDIRIHESDMESILKQLYEEAHNETIDLLSKSAELDTPGRRD